MADGDKKGGLPKGRGILEQFKLFIERNRTGEILVVRGLITAQDLRFLLKQQKQIGLPLGKICIEQDMISRRQLAGVLARQWVLRGLAAAVFAATLFPGILIKKARSETMNDLPAQMEISSVFNAGSLAKMESFPALFGTEEKHSANLKPFTKWTGMFARLENQVNSGVMDAWRKDLESLQGIPLKSAVSKVNDMMNRKRYIVDSRNWGQSDYWETPIEFMERGGDCEDFAIAKYAALRSLGVPEDRLRVAIVHDNVKNIPHAVLVVYTDEGAYALDNQIKTLVSVSGTGRYRPIFSINREGWWLHTAPDATMVASVQ